MGTTHRRRAKHRQYAVIIQLLRPGTESSLTLHWREMDSNFQYASTVRRHRATDLPLPPTANRAPRGAASHGETAFQGAAGFREARRRYAVHPSRNAVLRRRAGRPLSGARRAAMRSAPCEIRPGENVILQYLSHDGRPAPRRGGAATVRPAATAPSPTAKSLPLAPAGTASNFPWSGKKTATLYRGTAPADPILVHGNPLGRTRVPETGTGS